MIGRVLRSSACPTKLDSSVCEAMKTDPKRPVNRTSTLLHAMCIVWAIGSTGCAKDVLFGGGAPQRTVAPHPKEDTTRAVPPLVHRSPQLESERGLPPDTLVQEARFAGLQGQSMCFDLTLRGLSPLYADLRNWKIYLRSGTERRTHEHPPPQIDAQATSSETFDGLIPIQVRTGSETVCAEKDKYEQCVRWSEQPIISTQMTPGTVEVTQGGGTVCFPAPNFGPNVRKVALRLNASSGQSSGPWGIPVAAPRAGPSLDGPARLTFQWDFQ